MISRHGKHNSSRLPTSLVCLVVLIIVIFMAWAGSELVHVLTKVIQEYYIPDGKL